MCETGAVREGLVWVGGFLHEVDGWGAIWGGPLWEWGLRVL